MLKNKIGLILTSVVCALATASLIVCLKLASEANEIIYIRSTKDLEKIRNNLNGHFVFDVDGQIIVNEKWKPIGTLDAPFTGYIEGNYENISLIKGFDETIITGDSDEINAGFVGVNKGIIKHLSITSSNVFDENLISGKHKLNFGNVVGKNKGYVTGCSAIISSIKLGESFENSSVGGVVGLNSNQVQGCSFNTHFTFDSQFQANSGALVGYNNNGTVKYCWFNCNSYLSSSDYNSNLGSCIGYCDGGVIENVSLSTRNETKHQPVFQRVTSKTEEDISMHCGGLLGKAFCSKPITINCVTVDLTFEHNAKPFNFGFVCGAVGGSSSLTLSNCAITGTVVEHAISCDKAISVNSEVNGPNIIRSNANYYNVVDYTNFKDASMLKKYDFSSLSLKILNLDEAVWEKGNYSFYLIYDEKN